MAKKLLPFAVALATAIVSAGSVSESSHALATVVWKPLPGPTIVDYRAEYTITGHTGGTTSKRAVGRVLLRGRWNHGAFATIARTQTDLRGVYLVKFILDRRGRLDLRLLTPDGAVAAKTLQVS